MSEKPLPAHKLDEASESAGATIWHRVCPKCKKGNLWHHPGLGMTAGRGAPHQCDSCKEYTSLEWGDSWPKCSVAGIGTFNYVNRE